ncbi:hypothetical protein GINT2_001371 [Glugoides intestinalis]
MKLVTANSILNLAHVFGNNDHNEIKLESSTLEFKIVEDNGNGIDESYYESFANKVAIKNICVKDDSNKELKIFFESFLKNETKGPLKIKKTTAVQLLNLQNFLTKISEQEVENNTDDSYVTILTIEQDKYLLGKKYGIYKLINVEVEEVDNVASKIKLASNPSIHFAFKPLSWKNSFEIKTYNKDLLQVNQEILKKEEYLVFYHHKISENFLPDCKFLDIKNFQQIDSESTDGDSIYKLSNGRNTNRMYENPETTDSHSI